MTKIKPRIWSNVLESGGQHGRAKAQKVLRELKFDPKAILEIVKEGLYQETENGPTLFRLPDKYWETGLQTPEVPHLIMKELEGS